VLETIGGGGQSQVYKVRTPARSAEREKCMADMEIALHEKLRPLFAQMIWTYARPDSIAELGALKHFRIPAESPSKLTPTLGSDEYEAIERLKNEVKALSQNRVGLPKLLAANERERWIVTELFPEGSLERHILKYRGKALPALRAFRSLVATTATLHADGYVHRDIKPANVFLRADDELILGDFGIVYMPAGSDRLTTTNERVGPRDYMPPWGDLGDRLEKVRPNFDVYMLGKLLWCMIAGRMKLPREYHRTTGVDLEALFPDDRNMGLVNSILDRCVVERPEQSLASSKELLAMTDETLTMIEHGVPQSDGSGKLILPCRICGKGFYRDQKTEVRIAAFNEQNSPTDVRFRLFVCNVCTNYQFFAPGHPNEAATKRWKPWTS